MTTRRPLPALLLTLLLLTAERAWAQGPSAPPAVTPPAVEARIEDGVYTVQGRFDISASVEVARGVLGDYEHIAEFVPTVRKSIVRLRRADFIYVEQEAVETALFVSKEMHVLLRITEEGNRLSFRDISQRDFRLYEGAWVLEAVPGGCRVTYALRARPRLAVPGFIAAPAFKDASARLLGQVRAEMLRRAQAKAP